MNAELVEKHLGLVRMVAHRFISKNRNLEYDDLFQVGCIGLIKAVDRYDATRDCTFSTFAVYAINGEIMNYLRDHLHSLRVPRRAYVLSKQTLRFGLEESDVSEIAETLNCTIEEADQVLKELAAEVKTHEDVVNALSLCAAFGGWIIGCCEGRMTQGELLDALNQATRRKVDNMNREYKQRKEQVH